MRMRRRKEEEEDEGDSGKMCWLIKILSGLLHGTSGAYTFTTMDVVVHFTMAGSASILTGTKFDPQR